MAINETGWGSSTLATQANNYFGIKAFSGPGPAGTIDVETTEVEDGETVTVMATFRAYHSLDECVQDLGNFLHANPRYAAVFANPTDPIAMAQAMLAAGYGTDPTWADKLTHIIDTFNLRSLDVS